MDKLGDIFVSNNDEIRRRINIVDPKSDSRNVNFTTGLRCQCVDDQLAISILFDDAVGGKLVHLRIWNKISRDENFHHVEFVVNSHMDSPSVSSKYGIFYIKCPCYKSSVSLAPRYSKPVLEWKFNQHIDKIVRIPPSSDESGDVMIFIGKNSTFSLNLQSDMKHHFEEKTNDDASGRFGYLSRVSECSLSSSEILSWINLVADLIKSPTILANIIFNYTIVK